MTKRAKLLLGSAILAAAAVTATALIMASETELSRSEAAPATLQTLATRSPAPSGDATEPASVPRVPAPTTSSVPAVEWLDVEGVLAPLPLPIDPDFVMPERER